MAEHGHAGEPSDRAGPRVVIALYFLVVTIAGATGLLLGSLGIDGLRPVKLFFLIELQPTPLGLALYGAATFAVGLGIMLGLIVYVSRRNDL